MTKRDGKVRGRNFADLRGILSGRVESLTDEQLRQWIDEARSRAFESGQIKRIGRGTQGVDDKDYKQE